MVIKFRIMITLSGDIDSKRAVEIFWGAGNILYIDLGIGYMNAYICKTLNINHTSIKRQRERSTLYFPSPSPCSGPLSHNKLQSVAYVVHFLPFQSLFSPLQSGFSSHQKAPKKVMKVLLLKPRDSFTPHLPWIRGSL